MIEVDASALTCRICSEPGPHARIAVREMMFGSRETFGYFQCRHCGCLQIEAAPTDMDSYYPSDYFSLRKQSRPIGAVRAYLDRRRVRHALGRRSLQGALAARVAKPLDYLDWVVAAGADQESPILDVGCGTGRLLRRMHAGGFKDCTGIEPHIQRDLIEPGGIRIHKQELVEFARATSKRYRLIMFHHSFEHLYYPGDVLSASVRLLSPAGLLLIRVPLVDSEAWERYRENWFQIDAPRHFYLHSQMSMRLLAQGVGLQLEKIVFDSTPSQFMLSELFRRDVAMNEMRKVREVFSPQELDAFRRSAERANREGRGDMAAFYFRKSG